MPDPAESSEPSAKPSILLSATDRGVDGQAAAYLALGEHEMRRDLARGILRVFIVGNSAVWTLVAVLLVIDVVLVQDGVVKPSERIIDQGVVETLVGATTVQVGIIMALIARSLFRTK